MKRLCAFVLLLALVVGAATAENAAAFLWGITWDMSLEDAVSIAESITGEAAIDRFLTDEDDTLNYILLDGSEKLLGVPMHDVWLNAEENSNKLVSVIITFAETQAPHADYAKLLGALIKEYGQPTLSVAQVTELTLAGQGTSWYSLSSLEEGGEAVPQMAEQHDCWGISSCWEHIDLTVMVDQEYQFLKLGFYQDNVAESNKAMLEANNIDLQDYPVCE